jgi:hypothetical protein
VCVNGSRHTCEISVADLSVTALSNLRLGDLTNRQAVVCLL